MFARFNARCRAVSFAALLAAMLGSVAGVYASEWRFDFGPPADPSTPIPEVLRNTSSARYWAGVRFHRVLQDGWTSLHQWSMYDPSIGYGWVEPPHASPFERLDETSPLFHRFRQEPLAAVVSDGLVFAGEDHAVALRIDLPDGDYRLTIFLGDLGLQESRHAMFVLADGKPIVNGVDVPDTQVLATQRRVRVQEGKLLLQFFSRHPQGQQASVNGVWIEPWMETMSLTDRHIPDRAFSVEDASLNVLTLIERERQQWQDAQASLLASGLLGSPLVQTPYREGGTQLLLSMYGDYSRLLGVNPNIDMQKAADLLRRIGVDALIVRGPELARQYQRAGIRTLTSVHAERWQFPQTPVLQTLIDRDGGTTTMPGFFAIHDLQTQQLMGERWDHEVAPMRPYVSGVFIDEPRGMTRVGSWVGDYGPASESAFLRWLEERQPGSSAGRKLPRPGWTDAFYDFFRFRLESVAIVMARTTAGTAMATLPLLPGNGELSPLIFNHHNFYPPALAQHGMMYASWNYNEPFRVKASAEIIAATQREFGGHGAVFTMVSRDVSRNRQMIVAALSAKPHFLGPREGVDLALYHEASMLARTLAPAQPLRHIYLFTPMSLTFPDLVNFTEAEGSHWEQLARDLDEQGVDYGVSFRGMVPDSALLVYSPIEPVLNEQELNDLRGFLLRGGRLLYACAKDPVRPDGKSWGPLLEVLTPPDARQVLRFGTRPDAAKVRELAGASFSWLHEAFDSAAPLQRRHFILHHQPLVLLFNATGAEQTVKVGEPWFDLLRREKVAARSSFTMRCGDYRLLLYDIDNNAE